MSYSTAVNEALARAQIDFIRLYAVELRHPEFPGAASPTPGVIRLINHSTDVQITLEAAAPLQPSTAVWFTAWDMEIDELALTGNASKTEAIVLDNVNTYLSPYLNNANQTITGIQATIRIIAFDVDAGSVIQIMNTRHLSHVKNKEQLGWVNIELEHMNAANKVAPSEFYTPETHPGLYA